MLFGMTRMSVKTLVVALIIALLITESPRDAWAGRRVRAEADAAMDSNMPPKRNDRTKSTFNQSNADGWAWVATKCSDATSDGCAAAATVQVNLECGASTKFFRKDTRAWTALGFGMLIASAAFTGIGASATLSSAKVWSTLGGTTGLGAVSASVNSNVAGDQAGLSAVNTTLSNFLKYVQSGGTNSAPASNDLIYKSAPLYAAQCSAVANGSTGTAKQ